MGDPHPTDQQAVPKRRFHWLRAASDRVPTRWFAGIGTGAFLVATAAFGGLGTVTAASLPELTAGEEHRNDQLAISIQRAVLIDELPEAGVLVEPGQRVLALVVDAENTWDEPLPTTHGYSVSSTVALDDRPGVEPDGIARYDDSTANPWLQPGVPATIVIAWAVSAQRYAGGDELRVVLHDETLYTGTAVVSGRYWDDPVPASVVTLDIRDVGVGVDAAEPGTDAGAGG